uniref:Uncharacterized protein n=1 Tax=Arundo donax TaxID=35708 RepID=A0A0A9B0I9_ARUDO
MPQHPRARASRNRCKPSSSLFPPGSCSRCAICSPRCRSCSKPVPPAAPPPPYNRNHEPAPRLQLP